MRVLVCGATGCIGSAIAAGLRAHGHVVVAAHRGAPEHPDHLAIDYAESLTPVQWAQRLQAAGGFDVVVNAVGVLMPAGEATFERVHTHGPIALFRGAALAGVRRIVQISALGVGRGPEGLRTPYARSKLLADEALVEIGQASGGSTDWAIVRPSLVYGPRSQSAALFRLLASLPVVSLPGRGQQRVQPIHVTELAECVCRMVDHAAPIGRVVELGGPQVLGYREMLARYRAAQGLADPLWLPVPMPLMRLGAWCAQALPQKVFSPDTLAMLERGNTTLRNGAREWLGREATPMHEALWHEAPTVGTLPAPLHFALRCTLSAMWLYTALVTALMPQASRVLELLARCGFEGQAGVAVMWASCSLNTVLGLWLLLRPNAWAYAFQAAAVLGYTTTAAWNMPELTIDHCGPLIKNLPVLGLLLLLWGTASGGPARVSANNRPHADLAPAALERRHRMV
jgi:uncharacterized protein YbjT (DUF2867 family)